MNLSPKTPNQIFCVIEFFCKAEKFNIYFNKYKIIFRGKRGKPWKFAKNISLYWSFLSISSKVCLKLKTNLLSDWMLVQGSKELNLVKKIQNHFSGNASLNLKLSKIFFPLLKLAVKLILSLWKVWANCYYCFLYFWMLNIQPLNMQLQIIAPPPINLPKKVCTPWKAFFWKRVSAHVRGGVTVKTHYFAMISIFQENK